MKKIKKIAEKCDTKATAALFFPTQLQALVREMQRTDRGMPTMRVVVAGGSVLTASTAEAARKSFTGLKLLLNIYGMTESSGIVTSQPKTGDVPTDVDVGVPVTGVQIKAAPLIERTLTNPKGIGRSSSTFYRLSNVALTGLPKLLSDIPNLHHSLHADDLGLWITHGSHGQIKEAVQTAINWVDRYIDTAGLNCSVVDVYTRQKLGPYETGEICFRSLSVMRGYYKRPKETAELFDGDGWCKSGDAGYYDEHGRLYIVERLKQMIKCMDNQVVPAELEELLLRQYADEIEEVSVVGVPHPDFGEAPAAAIVLTEKGREQDVLSLAEKIKATISSNLAVHKHLYGGVYFVDSFPKTETAKVNRRALARSLLKV
ncbi:hypothetical protein HPB52_022400 [Rhipicephalus sanguineus]|uniref:Luciferin 4-monooxygenase n=1 Tax=Rhipicephalus sanguineus TaxID=34632 RepID=A0A9D4Q7P2_RHISA|nr:hypothetical protein HPB52_022400 [Rhipicephalus sanguineus]